MAVTDRRRWLKQLVEHQTRSRSGDAGLERFSAAATVVALAERVCGGESPLLAGLDDPPRGWADPWLIGAAHEQLVSAGERSTRGAWYTPQAVVEHLVERALPLDANPQLNPLFIVDPTCGGGGFLLATLDRLVALGVSPSSALDQVGGMDIDAGAVRASQLAINAWGVLAGAEQAAIDRAASRVRLGDQLEGWPAAWPTVNVIVGNPPFATPLRGRPFPAAAQVVREERRGRLGPYADLASIHLAVCVERVAPGGRVCLVLPQSILGGRDTAGLREWIDAVAPMADIWATKEPVFEASVRVWSPVLVKAQANGPLVASEGSWSEAAAGAVGAPRARLQSAGLLSDLLTSATAGFRDEFYALADACVELADVGDVDALPEGFLRLATVGSLDPLVSWWGRRPTTFAKRRWHAPVIDCAKVEGRSQVWLEQMRVPKVLLPTQSKVFEPFVDRAGTIAPATPLLALHAEPDAIDLVAAVLLAPPVVAWAFARWFGTAMSVEAIKVAARDLGSFPLPADVAAWREAAVIVASADGLEPHPAMQCSIEAAQLMHRAYGATAADVDADSVLQWWLARATTLVPSQA